MESVFLNIVSAWLAFNAAFVTTLVAGASARPRQSAKILPFVAPKKRRVNDRMLGIVPTGLATAAEATACASTSSSV
jgi:hypothetical protein